MGKPGLNDYGGYYADKLEQGLRFQDHVADVLLTKRGISLNNYVSKARGLRAENRIGYEIKRDSNFRNTGNLFIETAEKSNPDNPSFVPSGIRRLDNTIVLVIGDEITLWLMGKKHLIWLDDDLEKHQLTRVDNRTKTALGFLLPLQRADILCFDKIDEAEALQANASRQDDHDRAAQLAAPPARINGVVGPVLMPEPEDQPPEDLWP